MSPKDSKLEKPFRIVPFHSPKSWVFWLIDEEKKLHWEFPGWGNENYVNPVHSVCDNGSDSFRRKDYSCGHAPPKVFINLWKMINNLKINNIIEGECLCGATYCKSRRGK